MTSNSLVEKDRAHYFHPVVPIRAHEERGVTVMKSGKGVYLTDIEGNELLDGFAGLWCVNAGYGHDAVVDAAAEQMRRLPYATGYFHFGSEPAIELAAKLAELSPGDLDHIFFTLGGSDAVDTVIRMVRYYFNGSGQPNKKQFIALEKGYHGSTSNGAGLTALPVFQDNFDVPMQWQHHIPSPYPYRNDLTTDEDIIAQGVANLKAKVAELGVDNVAAFIMELVQGSGGVIVLPEGYAKAMQETCRELGILFIVDEVITAFGRTGPMFACEHESLTPDFLTTAKGLTSGYAPMGAVFVSDRIYQAIADAAPNGVPFGHGFTYSGHPVSAAVALEIIKLYEGGMIENAKSVGTYFEQQLKTLLDHPVVGDVRAKGLLGAVEIVTDKKTKAKPAKDLNVAGRLAKAGYENRIIFRAFADDVVGLAPPVCITKAEVDILISRLRTTLDTILDIEG
ncbi:aminotransferase class III-fold pyridoxal phosphate-dependent enzyme [Roseobacter sp.]|uniref:aminotransferase class III-fold pyridoxal phosphate-dependent enzyme n=1 Tax=Roseobacter sp. TaxID=1907202 RepID=UPI002966DB77|nr:aminotransferase class III-fold pyridoxal phosphate-dependent enzyme [Roseobacter sp.]MDW3181359.1 aminotransferase class III-fold pyridoxal phosphate-dependent enzyme [Roseobacter sp.]